jgi:hypothetical protein
MELTRQQINLIRQHLVESRVTFSLLQDDLLDHLCCLIELKMKSGTSFEHAIEESVRELAPSGLNEIQKQTDILLHPTKSMMRQLFYFIGLATTISMTMGIMFKLLHMPGGEQLFNYGFLLFSLIFLPAVAIEKYKSNRDTPMYDRLKSLFGFVSTVGVGCAVILKLAMKLDWSGVLLLVSVSVFCFGFLPFFFYDMYRDSMKRTQKE